MEQTTTIYQECLYAEIEKHEPDFRECGIKCENCKYSITLEDTSQKENKTKRRLKMWLVLLLMLISALSGASVMGMILIDKIERRDRNGRRK